MLFGKNFFFPAIVTVATLRQVLSQQVLWNVVFLNLTSRWQMSTQNNPLKTLDWSISNKHLWQHIIIGGSFSVKQISEPFKAPFLKLCSTWPSGQPLWSPDPENDCKTDLSNVQKVAVQWCGGTGFVILKDNIHVSSLQYSFSLFDQFHLGYHFKSFLQRDPLHKKCENLWIWCSTCSPHSPILSFYYSTLQQLNP